MASAAMSVDSGPESEFDFGDMEADQAVSRQRRGSTRPEKNILV